MSAGLNDSPKFMSALGQIVLQALGETVHQFVPAFNAETGRVATAPAYLAAFGLD
jgi:hypothetical protein